jgi:hypothetical protein
MNNEESKEDVAIVKRSSSVVVKEPDRWDL